MTKGSCFLCAGKCRGHSAGRPEEWSPEPGSAAARMTAQPSSQAEREDVALRTALVDYAMHYGPRSRECADHGDICPMSGMACGERRKATEFVVDALIYGAAHGYCPSALVDREHATPRSMPEEVDHGR